MSSTFRKVVIIVSEQDPHVNLVTPHLREEPVILVDAPEAPLSFRMHSMTLFPEILHRDTHLVVETGIWLRVQPISRLVGALPFMLPESICASPLSAILAASQPAVQLSYAKRAGMHVQPTLFTANIAEALEFVKRYSRCTVRPANNDWLAGRRKVTAQNTAALDGIQSTPSLIQPVITFSHNVRVVAVGNKVFGASVADCEPGRLYAQDTHDWREGLAGGTFRATQKNLPLWLVDQVQRFMKISGLKVAVLDFVVNREGHYVFIGCDPNGDWWFLEEHASSPIGNEIARLLQADV